MAKHFFNNILYIGDNATACRHIIELFKRALLEIEQAHYDWFSIRPTKSGLETHDRLWSYIHYHFEGDMAIFKFKRQEELPDKIVNDCIDACNKVALYETCFAA